MSSINETAIDINVNNIVQPIVNKTLDTILMEKIKEAYGVTTTATTTETSAPKYFITCPFDVEDGTYRHGDCYCSNGCFMR